LDSIPVHGKLGNLTKGLSPEILSMYEALTDVLLDERIPEDEKLAQLEESGLVMAQLRHHIAVAKIKPTYDIVKAELENGVDKILVLGWHRAPLEELADMLNCPLITGGMSDTKKGNAKADFINGKAKVLCGQIGAVATGTDGLQEVCHRGINMEMSWAYRDNKQGWHRLFRKGQTKPVHWSNVTLLGSVDEYVAHVFRRNADIFSKALD
jgi:hypothetical protein